MIWLSFKVRSLSAVLSVMARAFMRWLLGLCPGIPKEMQFVFGSKAPLFSADFVRTEAPIHNPELRFIYETEH